MFKVGDKVVDLNSGDIGTITRRATEGDPGVIDSNAIANVAGTFCGRLVRNLEKNFGCQKRILQFILRLK